MTLVEAKYRLGLLRFLNRKDEEWSLFGVMLIVASQERMLTQQELEDWRLSMPDQLRQAKHDAVNDVTPAIMEVDLQSQKRDEAVEARLVRLIEVRR